MRKVMSGTAGYIPPEMWLKLDNQSYFSRGKNNNSINNAIDTWAMGVLVAEVILGRDLILDSYQVLD
jgi:serine/threonine protein kinase